MAVLNQIHGHAQRFFEQDDLGKSHRARIGLTRMRSRNQRRALLLLGGAEIWTIEGRTVRIHLPFGGVARVNLFRGGYERRCVRDRESLAALEGGDGEGGRHCAPQPSLFLGE